ncbi:MAG: Maf family protein [Armatimonadota bacterium]
MISRKLILASASPRRRELLSLICPDFEVLPSEFDESNMPSDLPPMDHVVMSAKEKAMDVAAKVTDGIVIGSDTVVSIDEHILGKPQDERDAARMLRMLSGRTHQVYTGIHVIDVRRNERRERSGFECTDVCFRELTDGMIERYIATGEPMDKAGAYAIQGRGSVLIKGISGCYFNVVGLPVYKLGLILEESGLEALTCR